MLKRTFSKKRSEGERKERGRTRIKESRNTISLSQTTETTSDASRPSSTSTKRSGRSPVADQAVLDNLTKEQEAAIKQLQEEFIRTAGLQDLLVGDGSGVSCRKDKGRLPLFTELADATKSELQKIKTVIDGIEVTPDQKALLLTLGLTEKQVDELIKKRSLKRKVLLPSMSRVGSRSWKT